MLYNYLKIALRNLARFKTQFIISFLGLFLGLTAFLLLFHYTWQQLSFDHFHKNADRIVRLNTIVELPNQTNPYAATAFPVALEIKDFFPEVEAFVRIRYMPASVQYKETNFDEGLMLFADSSFFEVFSFPLLEGDPKTVLDKPASMVLTKTLAEKYFPAQNPIGKVVQVNIMNEVRDLEITGVVENPPSNSSMDFTMLANMKQITNLFRPDYASIVPGLYTFFQVNKAENVAVLKQKLPQYVKAHFPEELQTVLKLELQDLTAIFYNTNYQFDFGRKGNKMTLYSLLALGILTLLIAVVNYINIATALGGKRSKEIAIRKTLGSNQRNIATQHLAETFLLVMLVLFTGALAAELLLPYLETWVETDLKVGFLNDTTYWLFIIGLGLALTVLAGAYPAAYLARLSPLAGLQKGEKAFANTFDIRKILVGFQFAVTLFFMITAWIVLEQLSFLRNKDLGFTKENVLLFDVAGPEMRAQIPRIKQAFEQLASVESVSASLASVYGTPTQANFSAPQDSAAQGLLCDINYVDADFLPTYGIKLVDGRNFSEAITTDIGQSFIVNEAALVKLGLAHKETLIGTALQKIAQDTVNGHIVGVIRNYHYQSLHQEITPLIWQIDNSVPKNALAVRINGDLPTALQQLKETWNGFGFAQTFDYAFLDEVINNAYRSEQQLSWFIRLVTALLLFISCTGVYGMTLFLVAQKSKEIGIRKVFGATTAQLLLRLNRQHIILMLLGLLVGAPLALWLGSEWLQNFAYRIALQWYHVAGAGTLCILIALLSVSVLTLRAARRNPVETLRYE